MVGTRTTGNPIDAGQNDIRNMFPDVYNTEGHQVSEKTVGNQARNGNNQKDNSSKLTLLSRKSQTKDPAVEKNKKGKSETFRKESNEILTEPEGVQDVAWDSANPNTKQIMDLIDNNNNDVDGNIDNDERMESSEAPIDGDIVAINFKMEISPESKPSEDEVIGLLCSKVINLIKTWIVTENIEGTCIKEKYVLRGKLEENVLEWAIDHRVMFKKKVIVAETFLHLKTKLKVFQLCSAVKELCAKYHVKIEGKKTNKGFTKRIGFIVGPHVESASNEHYATQLVESINESMDVLEVKKQVTFDRKLRSKVLIVHGLEDEANRIDVELSSKKYPGFRYVSYKSSTMQQRLAAMHYNDVINIKSRYEILFDASVVDKVLFNGKEGILKEILLNVEDNEDRLFMAVEQGSGKGRNNIQVILNPGKKYKARKWLVEMYPQITFSAPKGNKTSVKEEEFIHNVKLNDDLKEFLAPVLQSKAATKVKKYGTRVKSYAHALGFEKRERNTESSQTIDANTQKSIHVVRKKSEEIKELKSTVQMLTNQLNKLTKIVTDLCAVVQDEEKKNQASVTLKEIINKENNAFGSPNINKDTDDEMELVDIECKKNENETTEKKKKQRNPHGYNIKQDDLTGKIRFNYAEIGQLNKVKKRRVNNSNE